MLLRCPLSRNLLRAIETKPVFVPILIIASVLVAWGGSSVASSPAAAQITAEVVRPVSGFRTQLSATGAPVSRAVPQETRSLFASQELLVFTLTADFEALNGDRGQESKERPGLVHVSDFFGTRVGIPVEVKTRGQFRLQEQICPDPPLRLDFPRSTEFGTVFDGQDKVKLVTHCRDSEEFQDNLLEEYLVYRMYNLLTDRSFGVRLARITYVDANGATEPKTRMAFLLEDDEALGERLGGTVTEPSNLLPNQYDLTQIGLMYLFQFMVGNVDWGTGSSHNVQVLSVGDTLFPIPYDFDWTGFVNAPYAAPNRLTQEYHDSVRERVYWGVCIPGIPYSQLFQRFNEERDEMVALIREEVDLSPEAAAAATQYLEEFFAILDDPVRAQQEIIDACRPWL